MAGVTQRLFVRRDGDAAFRVSEKQLGETSGETENKRKRKKKERR